MSCTETCIEVQTNDVEIQSKNTTEIAVPSTLPTLVTAEKEVPTSTNVYTISSGGMYCNNSDDMPGDGDIPGWLNKFMDVKLSGPIDLLNGQIAQLKKLFDDMEVGLHQYIQQINTDYESLHLLVTTNKSELNDNIAGIYDALLTKVTEDQAEAISLRVLGAEFTNPNSQLLSSWFLDKVKTYSDAVSTTASRVTALASVVEDPTTGVAATADVLQTAFTHIGLNSDGSISADARYSNYIATAMGPQQIRIASDDTVHIDSNGNYQAVTSKMIIDPNGVVSGWTNSNLNGRSNFTITADTFRIQGATTGLVPFEVNAVDGQIDITSVVHFRGLGLHGGSTTIDGGYIKTGTIDADQINANAIHTKHLTVDAVDTGKIKDGSIRIHTVAIGGYSATASYYSDTDHTIYVSGEWVQGTGRGGEPVTLYFDGSSVRTETPIEGTTNVISNILRAGPGTHTISLNARNHVGDMRCTVMAIGVKR